MSENFFFQLNLWRALAEYQLFNSNKLLMFASFSLGRRLISIDKEEDNNYLYALEIQKRNVFFSKCTTLLDSY
jgi:hypothetical protein